MASKTSITEQMVKQGMLQMLNVVKPCTLSSMLLRAVSITTGITFFCAFMCFKICEPSPSGVGGGKSSIAEKLKYLMQQVPIYSIKGSPVNDHPLALKRRAVQVLPMYLSLLTS